MEENIKYGLRFNLNTLNNIERDQSYLSRKGDSIKISCMYSGIKCNLNSEEESLSYLLEFYFSNEYLKSYSSDFDLNQFPIYQVHEICCNTQMILHEIIHCKLEGVFKKIFLESKSLALLLCFQKCSTISLNECSSCKFLAKPIEKEKILKAKDILLSSLNNPPTIPELSLLIGTNQCYLKKGFKEVYGLTVYEYVQEQRMLKAKLLLSTSNFTISQVADEIGYSSAGNFSNAFKKYAGVFPSELQQN